MSGRISELLTALLDLISPPRESDLIARALTLADLQKLAPRGQGGALPYGEKKVKALVWELKYYKNPHAAALAGAYLAEPLLAIAADGVGTPLLIPVPMHAARRRQRGHNQTEMLCKAVLKVLSVPQLSEKIVWGLPEDFFDESCGFEYVPELLARERATPEQQKLERGARLTNVAGSMAASPRVSGRRCVVVDDVSTTGATFAECRRALLAAGAASVECVALAQS